MYGITKGTREIALKQIQKEKTFLENHFFEVGNDLVKMSDVVKKPYHNANRYIAEVNQRVYSLNTYAQNKGLKPIFGTITLPTEYHPKINNKIPNPKFIDDNKHTPNAGAKELSRIFKLLLSQRFLSKNISKEDKCYFRVYEPHKDGTPHLHFVLYVPEEKLNEVHSKMSKYFKNNFPKQRVDFQIDVINPIAYLMKYILKTFDDLRGKTDNITDLSLWYKVNKITRFYTSRTLISLDVYRALNGKYDLLELTYMYQNREIVVWLDTESNKLLSIEDSICEIWKKKTTKLEKTNQRIKLKYKKKKIKPLIFINGCQYLEDSNGRIIPFEPIIPINKRSDMTLYNDYITLNNTDINLIDMNVFGLIKNELINRDIINDKIMPISEYNYAYIIK